MLLETLSSSSWIMFRRLVQQGWVEQANLIQCYHKLRNQILPSNGNVPSWRW